MAARWYRRYVGTNGDPKFGGVARRCGARRQDVVFVFDGVLESIAEANEEGPTARYRFDADAMAELMGMTTPEVQNIHDELERSGLFAGGEATKWNKRQFQSDHDSTERSRRSREKHRSGNATLQQQPGDVAGTLQQQPSNVDPPLRSVAATTGNGEATRPETEPEGETEKKEPLASLASRACEDGTLQQQPSSTDATLRNGAATLQAVAKDNDPPEFLRRYPDDFEAFAAAYPHPSASWSKPATFEAWKRTARTRPALALLLDAVEALKADIARRNARRPKNDPVYEHSAVRFLDEERWAGLLLEASVAAAAKATIRAQADTLWGGNGAFIAEEYGDGVASTYFVGSTMELSADGKDAILTVDKSYKRDIILNQYAARIERRLGLRSLSIRVAAASSEASVSTATAA